MSAPLSAQRDCCKAAAHLGHCQGTQSAPPGRILTLSCLPTPDVLHQISHREHGCDGAGLQDAAGRAAAALQGEAAGAGEAAAPQGLRVSHRLLTQVLVFSSWALFTASQPGRENSPPSLPASSPVLSSWYIPAELCTAHS